MAIGGSAMMAVGTDAHVLPLRRRGPGWLRMAARRSSTAARWCQRLAVFAVPYLAVVLLGHRLGAIETPAVFWLLSLGATMLLAALVLGMVGFHDLWTHGHRGGMRSFRGSVLALIMLAPFAFFAAKAFMLPPIADVSTDLADPPPFEAALDDRAEGTNAIRDLDAAHRTQQLSAYPGLAARRYSGDIDLVLKAVLELISDRDWEVLAQEVEEPVVPVDVEGSAREAAPTTTAEGLPLRVPVPTARPDPESVDEAPEIAAVRVAADRGDDAREDADERYIEALATSDLLGFESDVVIRLVEIDEETVVDMRSASRYGVHDLGANAARIEAFMRDLDEALRSLSG